MADRPHRRRAAFLLLLGVLLVAVAMALTACGSDSSSSSTAAGDGSESSTEAGGESGSGVSDAKQTTEAVYEGARFGEPPTESSPAEQGKSVWVIQAGASSPTSAAVAEGVESAVGAIGWKSTPCDGKLDPSAMVNCYEQAIAAKPDGIIGIATDCSVVQAQLEKAKSAGIVTVPSFSFDCDEEEGGGAPVFGGHLSFGDRYPDLAGYLEASGEDAAAWVVAETNGEAEVLNLVNAEYTNLKKYQSGFGKGMAKYCADCVSNEVSYLAAEFGPKLQAKIAAALTKYPNANSMQGTFNPQLGPTQAILAANRTDIKNIGGLGIALDAETVRQEEGLTATVAEPLGWLAYASVDTLNSVFAGKEPRDSGVGWTIFDAKRNLPAPDENYTPQIDYEAAYAKSWGK